MLLYSVKRVAISLFTIFVLASATFFLSKVLPGNPFMNDKVPVVIQQRQLAYYGLDKPVAVQYVTYMKNLLRGDLGTSLKRYGLEVVSIIRSGFPVSAALGLVALFYGQIAGWSFGILAAQFKNRWPDYLLMVVAILGIALPSMVIGPIMRYIFGVKLHVLPVTGWGTWKHYVLPVLILMFESLGGTARGMRANMLNVSTQDYMKTARAKGMHPARIVLRHQLKNASVPVVTGLGFRIATIIMGSFVVENIFLIPGLGKYMVEAINTLDYPVIMGLTVFYGTFLVFMNFLVDLVYGMLDPRIRIA